MSNNSNGKTVDSALSEYKVGDSDNRPWGHYVVTAVGKNDQGEEYCDKDITVKPGQILSLQSHDLRREHWMVKEGNLTVVLDGQRIELKAGEDVRIPLKGIHCMANLSDGFCVVAERQEGICREEDIRRYLDAYGRGTEKPETTEAQASVDVYQEILKEISAGNFTP